MFSSSGILGVAVNISGCTPGEALGVVVSISGGTLRDVVVFDFPWAVDPMNVVDCTLGKEVLFEDSTLTSITSFVVFLVFA